MGNRTMEVRQLEDKDSRAAGLEAPGKASWHMQASCFTEKGDHEWLMALP